MYYYVENYLIKQIFYSGFNESYVNKIRHGKKEKLKLIKISSEIKDYSKDYDLWFDFITSDGLKIQSEKRQIDCTKVCDERGYVQNDKVIEEFEKILKEEIQKI